MYVVPFGLSVVPAGPGVPEGAADQPQGSSGALFSPSPLSDTNTPSGSARPDPRHTNKRIRKFGTDKFDACNKQNFDSSTSHLHELQELKLLFVSRIEFIILNFLFFSSHESMGLTLGGRLCAAGRAARGAAECSSPSQAAPTTDHHWVAVKTVRHHTAAEETAHGTGGRCGGDGWSAAVTGRDSSGANVHRRTTQRVTEPRSR